MRGPKLVPVDNKRQANEAQLKPRPRQSKKNAHRYELAESRKFAN